MTILDVLTTYRGDTYELILNERNIPEILFNGKSGYKCITVAEGKKILERLAILYGKEVSFNGQY